MSTSRRANCAVFLSSLLLLSQNVAALGAGRIVVSAGKHDRQNVVVAMPLAVDKGDGKSSAVELVDERGTVIIGQLTRHGFLASHKTPSSESKPDVLFVLPKLDAGNAANLLIRSVGTASVGEDAKFSWHDSPGNSTELRFGKRPVLRYMYEALDESTKQRREDTCKIYHHVFSPDGKQLVTKGPGGLFPHHRGLFYGFNRISYGDRQQADVWHCRNGEWQAHVKMLGEEAGPVLGRHRVAVEWHGRDGKVFADEQRELTSYNVPGGTLVEFASVLTSKVGKLKLDGDPQHAGFQFRASQEVPEKTKAQTYYLRPDGRDKPGSFRNWTEKDPKHENLPWLALSFVVGGERYTALYMDHPQNPKPARYSERDYGRFGCYFAKVIDDSAPLAVRYRVFLKEGEMTVDEAAAIARDFAEPVTMATAE
jgi:hypothetical protein